jgi:polar amino acid transport system substrate-binding protein
MHRGGILAFVMAVLITALIGTSTGSSGASPGTFDAIKKRGVLSVGTEANYYPFEFLENGKIVGYDKDILDAIVKDWGVKLNQADMVFTGLLPAMMGKKFDFVCTALLINPDRAKKYAFTQPIAQVKVGLLKRKGDPKVKSVDDLSGLVIATGQPPAGPTVIFMHYNDDLKKQGKGAKDQKMFSNISDQFVALANGQVDAMVESTPPLLGGMKKNPGVFELVGTFGNPFWVGWVTRPDDLDLRDALNAEIKKLRDGGQLAQWQKKWFGYTMELPDSGYLPPGAIQ